MGYAGILITASVVAATPLATLHDHYDDLAAPPLSISLTAPYEPSTQPAPPSEEIHLLSPSATEPAKSRSAREYLERPEPRRDDSLAFLGDHIDLAESERPWSTTTSVRVLSTESGRTNLPVPFISVAREVDSLDAAERFGIGGGLRFPFDGHMRVTGELLHLPNRTNENPQFEPETRAMVLFEIDF